MAAISSGRPARFIGVMWPMRASTPRSRACSKTLRVICVSTRPGRIALTRTPVPLKALAAHCVRLFTAALLALYEIAPAFARSEAADEHRGPLFGEAQRAGTADAAAGAGDHGALAGQSLHRRLLVGLR